MPLRLLAPLAALVLVAACSGEGSGGAETVLLGEGGFKDKVASAIVTRTDFQAEPGFGAKVRVTDPDGPDWREVELDDAYARYRREPARQDEIVARVVRDVARELEQGNSALSFAEARTSLVPLLKERAEVRGYAEPPAASDFLADLVVLYAVHRDGSFAIVRPGDVERWGRPLAELEEIALDNLLRRTHEEEPLLCEPAERGKLCGWASGDGYDATRMLVPELREEIRRELGGPAVYAVPRDDVYVALARRLAPRIRARVLQQFTTAPNPLSPELFVERDGELAVLEE